MGSYKIEDNNMTLEEAKKVYKKNNCSLFVMAREDMDNYTLYKKLNIDRVLEQKWELEVIEDFVKQLEESGDSRIFNRLYDLSVGFHDKERLFLMIKLIDKVRVEDVTTSLCIAETIMGRKLLSVRSGMIFWAYDLGLKDETIMLIRKVLSLIDIQFNDKVDEARVTRDQRKIREIIDVLALNAEIFA